MPMETTMPSHINNLKSLVRKLTEVGAKVKDEDAKALLLNTLPSTFNNVVFTLSQLSSLNLDDIVSTLLVEEKRLNA